MIKTAFEGSSQGLRLEQKGLLSGGPDSLSARELRLLWNRSHHLCRNNPAAVTAKNRLVSHWIGTGIKVRWSDKQVQKLWNKFVKNPSVDGFGNLYTMQNLWGQAYFESGEVFTRMLTLNREDMKIPLKLQVLEAEQLDPLYSTPNNIRFGIEFNRWGKPLTYYFWKRNPNDKFIYNEILERVPVKADDVIHTFQRERPGQWRGLPRLASVLLPLYEMDELTDATLVRQKVAQAIGWIIKKTGSGALPLLGDIESPSGTAVQENEALADKKIQKILPGGVHYLNEDEEFEFASIDDIGQNLLVMLKNHWHLIASALDITYEQLTGDLSEVNFSSIRAGAIEFRRRVAVTQQFIFVAQGLKPLTDRFAKLASVFEGTPEDVTCKFIFPKTEWVEPLKDVQADILEIRAGLATMRDKLEERQVEDIEDHIKQLAEEQGLDIVLDSNPKHNTMGVKTIADGEDDSTSGSKSAGNKTSKPKKARELK